VPGLEEDGEIVQELQGHRSPSGRGQPHPQRHHGPGAHHRRQVGGGLAQELCLRAPKLAHLGRSGGRSAAACTRRSCGCGACVVAAGATDGGATCCGTADGGKCAAVCAPMPLEPELLLVPPQEPLMAPSQEPLMVPPFAMAPPMVADVLMLSRC
jgi:hypothetical protein